MNIKQLQTTLRAALLDCLTNAGINDLPVVAGNQPQRSQGRIDRGLWFWTLSESPRGWQGRETRTNPTTLALETIETQFVQTTFQVSVLSPDDPNNTTEDTALYLCALARMLIQSNRFTQAMTAAGVGVQMPTPIRAPFFVNDRDEYEQNPSFDFTVSRKIEIIQTTPEAAPTLTVHRI